MNEHSLPPFISAPDVGVYLHGEFVILDFETSAKQKGSPVDLANRLILACWYTSWDGCWHYKWGQEYEQQELIKDLERASFVVAQNAKFELGWLDRCGVDIHDILCFDTMLAEWVLLGNKKAPINLGANLERRGLEGKEDVVNGMIKLGIDPLNIPRPLLLEYCFEDVRATLELFLVQRDELAARQQLHLIYSRCLLTPVLADIEKQGIRLDKDQVIKEYERVTYEYNEAKRKLQEFGEINWNSPKQKAGLIYDTLGFQELKDRKGKPIRSAAGGRKTDDATLGSLKAKNKKQQEFLDLLRHLADLQAKLSKSLQFFKTVVEEYGEVFYGELNQGRTGTHRLSSSGRKVAASNGESYGAQLQNLPREYKKFVVPKKAGHFILECDGSQIEFRVAADMGHDRMAYEEIVAHADIHTATAKALLENGQEGFERMSDSERRQESKSRTFRPLYGGSSGSPAEQAYCKFFQGKYTGIFNTQRGWTYEVLKQGYLRTPYGLEFYWPGTSLSKSGYITNTTSIFNYPIQGFATGEIIPIVLFCLWHRLRNWDVSFILTVHDSIIMEVGPDVDMDELKRIIAEAFTSDVYNYLEAVYGYHFVVPLGCSVKWGKCWSDGKEIKADMLNSSRILNWYE